MHILHTEWMKSKGGQAMRVLEDLKIIRELGHIPYLACNGSTWLYGEAKKNGIEVFDVPFSHMLDVNSFLELYKIIKDNKIDIVHTHSSKDSYSATFAAKLLSVKVIRSRHMALTKKPGILYRIADKVITTGEKIKQELVNYGIESAKIVSIPSYPDERLFIPSLQVRIESRKQYQVDHAFVIGTMTGYNSQKRPRWLLPLLKKLSDDGLQTVLLLAGGNDDKAEIDLFNSLVEKLALQAQVKYVGFVKPEVFLNAIDVYVCPSSSEGIPQALMQAMMVGKAAVSTNVGSICDLNSDENLLLVDKDDDEGMYHFLKSLSVDKVLRDELARKNHALMRIHHSRSVMKEQTRQLYEGVI